MRILPTDRSLVVGSTGSGKSTFAGYLFGLFRPQRVLIDCKAEWRLAGAVVVRSPAQLEAALADRPLIRYVPSTAERDEWETVYSILFQRRRLVIWTDEAAEVSEAGWRPRGLRLIQMQGRAKKIGHIACTQRPFNIAPELGSEAEHIFVFPPPFTRRGDLEAIAGWVGLDRDELRSRLLDLPRYGFLWYDRREGELTTSSPLSQALRRRSAATARAIA